MSGNAEEWSTETNTSGSNPCIVRGGWYATTVNYAGGKTSGWSSYSYDIDISRSFRPILYL